MPKTIAYIRVSTDTQTVENQKFKILEYAQEHKISIHEFISIEISTRKNTSERKIEHLKELLCEGDTLIVTSLSRLGRNMLEVLNIIDYFNKNEIKIIFINQPELSTSGTNSAMKDLLFSIYGYFDQSNREMISINTKMGLERAKANGKTLGRPKGSTGFSKLDVRKEEVIELLRNRANKSYMSRVLKVSVPCLTNFITSRKLVEKLTGS